MAQPAPPALLMRQLQRRERGLLGRIRELVRQELARGPDAGEERLSPAQILELLRISRP